MRGGVWEKQLQVNGRGSNRMAEPEPEERAVPRDLRATLSLLRQAASKYEDMIVRDPGFTSNLESALKVASYIIPGVH